MANVVSDQWAQDALSGEPFALFDGWLADAERTEPNDPNAMALATADENGVPSVRIVLLKARDARGFGFFTNVESRKGDELLANPNAALCFHWKSLRRQIRIEGAVERVTEAEADTYFVTRPRGSRIGAWASLQSRTLPNRAELERRTAEFEARYPGEDVPRPPHWSGFRVVPRRIEFWQDRPFRLHDRILFERDREGDAWRTRRLYP